MNASELFFIFTATLIILGVASSSTPRRADPSMPPMAAMRCGRPTCGDRGFKRETLRLIGPALLLVTSAYVAIAWLLWL